MKDTIRFACGCVSRLREEQTGGDPPTCPTHGARIVRVTVRPPHFRGLVSGPHAQTMALDPATPTIGTAVLRLKGEGVSHADG